MIDIFYRFFFKVVWFLAIGVYGTKQLKIELNTKFSALNQFPTITFPISLIRVILTSPFPYNICAYVIK